MERKRSQELFDEAQNMFPGGVHSPVRAFKSVEGPPLFITKGEGARITDVDGNEFLDFCCSWGPLILGHNNTEVRDAIQKTVASGTSFGTPTPLGNEIGKIILDNHRFLDKIRFVSSGTEAVMSAVRLARGFTGKSKIIKFEGCYHGHVDSLLVKAGSGLATFGIASSAGVPDALSKETIVLKLNDLEAVKETMEAHDDIAALIIEPIPANNGLLLQDTNFLFWLRKLCDDNGVLLIFDEVISGFRVGFEGAAGFYEIAPDLITFGKIIGGGMPVGAFGGREEIMNMVAPLGPVYQAGTLSANPVTLAAGIATLKQLLKPGFYIEMASRTQFFTEMVMGHCAAKGYPVRMPFIGSIFWLSFSAERVMTADDIDPSSADLFRKLHSILLENGIYMGPSGYEVGFVSDAHTRDDLEFAAIKINEALDTILG